MLRRMPFIERILNNLSWSHDSRFDLAERYIEIEIKKSFYFMM